MSASIRIRRLELAELAIPFRTSFRHASAERSETSSVWVEAESERGAVGYGEGCPRPYVTGETLATAREFFLRHEGSLRSEVSDLDSLRAWAAEHAAALDESPAAWCAVELAILDLLARESDQTIEALLSLPALHGRFTYTAILGDASDETFRATAEEYRRRGFMDIKVKVSGDLARDRGKVAALMAWDGPPPRVRVDANNLWQRADEAVSYLRALELPLFAVEEPIGANDYAGMARVGAELACQVVLDESFRKLDQLPLLGNAPGRWVINLRVSKMGGLLRSLEVVAAARRARVPLIVGAQVGETSLLTRAALTIAHAARDILVAQEGAFGTLLLARDVCNPPLMFGRAGLLDVSDHPRLSQPGLGIVPEHRFARS